MGSTKRTVLDLRSQDLDVGDLQRFRSTVEKEAGKGGMEELISFTAKNQPYNYGSLPELKDDIGKVPDDASFFYYTIIISGQDRCSLYLDPDRPGKVVIEGTEEWVSRMGRKMEETFPRGGVRFKVHQRFGVLVIWSIVIIIAALIILGTFLFYELDPVIISTVIFTSSILGIYLSLSKAKELQPANTISFVKRRNYWLETLLHALTVGLGIVCAILAAVLVQILF